MLVEKPIQSGHHSHEPFQHLDQLVMLFLCRLVAWAQVLFRVGLALLTLHETLLLKLDNAGEVLRALKEASQAWWDASKLMDVAFNRVGGLPLARVTKIRHAQQVVVDQITREREAARRAADAKAAEAAKQKQLTQWS